MPLSGPLSSWLLTERSDEIAIATIRKSDLLTVEARAAVPALREAALTPANEAQVRAIVGQRFALFPQPQRNDGEWAAWWADYFEALKGLTPFAIEAGMSAWVRSHDAEFLCKPGKLRELAMTTPNDNRWAKAHHRAVTATHVPETPTPETKAAGERMPREKFDALMADFASIMADKDPFAKIKAKASRPTPSARVDNTGVSEEMRNLLARQQQQRC